MNRLLVGLALCAVSCGMPVSPDGGTTETGGGSATGGSGGGSASGGGVTGGGGATGGGSAVGGGDAVGGGSAMGGGSAAGGGGSSAGGGAAVDAGWSPGVLSVTTYAWPTGVTRNGPRAMALDLNGFPVVLTAIDGGYALTTLLPDAGTLTETDYGLGTLSAATVSLAIDAVGTRHLSLGSNYIRSQTDGGWRRQSVVGAGFNPGRSMAVSPGGVAGVMYNLLNSPTDGGTSTYANQVSFYAAGGGPLVAMPGAPLLGAGQITVGARMLPMALSDGGLSVLWATDALPTNYQWSEHDGAQWTTPEQAGDAGLSIQKVSLKGSAPGALLVAPAGGQYWLLERTGPGVWTRSSAFLGPAAADFTYDSSGAAWFGGHHVFSRKEVRLSHFDGTLHQVSLVPNDPGANIFSSPLLAVDGANHPSLVFGEADPVTGFTTRVYWATWR